jgi:hypothetical protein
MRTPVSAYDLPSGNHEIRNDPPPRPQQRRQPQTNMGATQKAKQAEKTPTLTA